MQIINSNENPSENSTVNSSETSPENPSENSTVNPSENLSENSTVNSRETSPEIQTFYYAHDANKNVTALFDSTGNIAQTYNYSPFGNSVLSNSNPATPENSNSVTNTNLPENSVTSNSVANFNLSENSVTLENVTNSERFLSTEIIENPFRFSSEYHDDELNLIYYNYRHYDPATGRFLSRDPIEEQGGTNLYNFTTNNPINKFDSYGLLYSRCILLPKSKATKIKRQGSKFLFNLGIIQARSGIVIQRKCYFRCYYDGRDNCASIPCKNNFCKSDHGVEELITLNSRDGKSPASDCSAQYSKILKRG